MSKLFIDWHLGLGDAIICNGMVRHFAKHYNEVLLPTYMHNLSNVSQMFSDLANVKIEPAIELADFGYQSSEYQYLKLGDRGKNFRSYSNFAEGFYAQANLPYEISYSEFKLASDHMPFITPKRPFMLIHEDEKRNYIIDPDKIDFSPYKNNLSIIPFEGPGALASWVPYAIAEADEIHCIDSVMLHLVDRVYSQAKCYLHRYARPYQAFDEVPLRHDWTILK